MQAVTQPIADSLGMKTGRGRAGRARPSRTARRRRPASSPATSSPRVNGNTVKDPRGLAQEIAGLAPGTSVKLDVLRNGKSKTITLTLGDMPQQQQNPPA